jgi:hypothetical protein
MLKWWFRPLWLWEDSALLSLPEQKEEPESITFSMAWRQIYGELDGGAGRGTRLQPEKPKHYQFQLP